jgi:hypothetical protein
MGRRGRERVQREFSTQIVVAQTMDVYHSSLGRCDIPLPDAVCVS